MKQLVIASNNKKKRAEIAAIVGALGMTVLPAEKTVFVDVVENGETFADNAKKKAIAFMLANALPALGDDSGLCVAALKGAPGVYSARFSGENATDARNNSTLLAKMSGETQRHAYFICALHLAFPDATTDLTAEGQVQGEIVTSLTGDTGFGYDPLFFSPELGKTFAQSSPEEKAAVSHRGLALQALQKLMKRWAISA